MSPVGPPTEFNCQERSAIRWATIDEAAKLIRMKKNPTGLAHDLSVLVAVQLALKEIELESDALVEKALVAIQLALKGQDSSKR
jgi:hypothetical protein